MNDVVKSARRVIRDVNRREKEDDRRKYMEEMKVASIKQKRAKINKGSKIIERPSSSSRGCGDGAEDEEEGANEEADDPAEEDDEGREEEDAMDESNKSASDEASDPSDMEDDAPLFAPLAQGSTARPFALVCRELLDTLAAESVASPFMVPVDLAAFPDYADFVGQPMDLGTVRDKVGAFSESLVVYSSSIQIKRKTIYFISSRQVIWFESLTSFYLSGGGGRIRRQHGGLCGGRSTRVAQLPTVRSG